jgi:hypothetical protein
MKLATTIALLLVSASTVAQAPMPSAAAIYAQGVPWDQYLAAARVQRETWLANAGREVPAALVERMKQVREGLRVLVVTADWCTDSVHSVPYLARLASRAGVDLRVVTFQTGKPILETHRTPDARASTPTVILLRGDQEVAAWVERPAALQWWSLGIANEISEAERKERTTSWYGWNRGTDALTEIVALAERTAKKN